jgi:hypothetical protein
MKNKTTIILAGIILLLLIAGFFTINYYKKQAQNSENRYKLEVLRNDKLEKVAEGHYRKKVADSLTQKQLNKIVDSLGLELKTKPKTITKIKFVPIEVEKPIDSISIIDHMVNIVDYYPDIQTNFIKYSNKFNLLTSKGVGKFEFSPIDISIVLSQREDGIFQSDIKVPDFISIGSVDIQSTPMEIPKIDNFGWILGVGYGKQFNDSDFVRFTTGIRYKKIYLEVGGNTNNSVDGGIKFEF